MEVVHGSAQLRVAFRVAVERIEHHLAVTHPGGVLVHPFGYCLVGVGQIGHSRQQNCHRCRFGFFPGAHEKGDVVLRPVCRQPHGVDAAAQVVIQFQFEVLGPAGVLQVVVVEMDGPVLRRSALEMDIIPFPVESGHRPGRHVHGDAVELIVRSVGDSVGGHVSGEIPGGQQVVFIDFARLGPFPQGVNLSFVQGSSEQPGAVDLAVVQAGGGFAIYGLSVCGSYQQRRQAFGRATGG